jgi:hypothetical protein
MNYPFNEGDTYYTIDSKGVIESTWDNVSEELYDTNPKRTYFATLEEATAHYNKINNTQTI